MTSYVGGCYRGREDVERFVADTSENGEELQILAEEFCDLGCQLAGAAKRTPKPTQPD